MKFEIKDIKENNSLVLEYFDTDIVDIKLRNDCIVLEGDGEFTLTKNTETDNFLIETFYLINNNSFAQDKQFSVIKNNNLEIKLVKKFVDYDLLTSINEFNNLWENSEVECFYFVIFKNEVPVCFLDYKLENEKWYQTGFLFKKKEIKIYFDRKVVRDYKSFETGEISRELFQDIDFSNDFKLFSRAGLLIKSIECYSFYGEIEKLTNKDWIDYKYTDFYQIRECSSECLSASPVYYPEINRNVYCPRKIEEKNNNTLCYWKEFHSDENGILTEQCPLTKLVSINGSYPIPTEFGKDIIQSTHYKVSIDLSEAPVSENAIIEEDLLNLLIKSLEFTRPVSRVSHFEEYLTLKTDFSGNPVYLYDKQANSTNWKSVVTAERMVDNNSSIFQLGDSTFELSKDKWEITHNLESKNIICQTYDLNGKMKFPKYMYPVGDMKYTVDWGIEKPIQGYALMTRTDISQIFLEFYEKPFIMIHGAHSSTQPDIVQIYNIEKENKVFNPQSFHSEQDKLYVGLHDKYFNRANTLLLRPDKYYRFTKPSKKWEIDTTDLKYWSSLIQIYDENYDVIYPKEIIQNKSKMVLVFENARTGYVGIKNVGNPRLRKWYYRRYCF